MESKLFVLFCKQVLLQVLSWFQKYFVDVKPNLQQICQQIAPPLSTLPENQKMLFCKQDLLSVLSWFRKYFVEVLNQICRKYAQHFSRGLTADRVENTR